MKDELLQYEKRRIMSKAEDLFWKLNDGYRLAMTRGYHGEDMDEDLQFLITLLLKDFITGGE